MNGCELLLEQWERRCVTIDRLAKDAELTASDETVSRLRTKAGVIRSMTVELKRALRDDNTSVTCPQERSD